MSDTIDIYQNYFSATSRMWHDNVSLKALGESGELIPIPLQTDSWVNLLMVILITISAIMIIKAHGYMSYKLNNLSRRPQFNSTINSEATRNSSYLTCLICQGVFFGALLSYAYVTETGLLPLAPDYMRYVTLALFTLAFMVYLVIRKSAIQLTHLIFYQREQRVMSHLERHFFLAIECIILLIASIAYMYLGISALHTIYAAIFMVIISKTIGFYKQYLIFFSKNGLFLRFFLYLCTLEAIPIALLIGILGFITHALSTNF